MRKVRSRSAAKRRRKTARPRKSSRADAGETALAMLAHEIRTPLNGILALSELIAAADLPERERQWAGLVKGAAEHLANLMTLVVDGVRAGKRGLVLREELFRPRALAKELGATLAARAEAKGLTADISIADDLPELVTGDRVRLRAALENLIDNAVKFTERGRVAMTVDAKGPPRRRRLTFAVTDSGSGIAPKELARLFRPFAQANTGSRGAMAGRGLGLPSCAARRRDGRDAQGRQPSGTWQRVHAYSSARLRAGWRSNERRLENRRARRKHEKPAHPVR